MVIDMGLLFGVPAITFLVMLGGILLAMYIMRESQRRVVKCPAKRHLVEVELESSRPDRSTPAGRHPKKVKNCPYWPENKGCDQSCVKPI